MNFLETILALKREEVGLRKRTILRSTLEEMPGYAEPRLSLARALRGRDMAPIVEVRRPSAAHAAARRSFDPLAIARQCVRAGARAVSVPTDEKFQGGRLDHIPAIRRFLPVPAVRRDFLLDSYQLYEARAFGADAVLLVAAALDSRCLLDLAEESRTLGLECLVEVHSEEEIEAIDFSRIDVVGIDNRDLMTLDTDILTSVRLRKLLPPDAVVISENGIRTAGDLRILMQHNIHAVLLGEHLLEAEDPAATLHGLLADAGVAES